jgi:uncharacterized protein
MRRILVGTKNVYFEDHGPDFTDQTLALARQRADELGIRDVIVASHTGETGAKAVEAFADRNVVVVAGVVGFRLPNERRLDPTNKALIEESGGKVLVTGHAFGMLGRAVNKQFGAIQVDEVIAHTLRLFSQGVKVACEVACMATDAGLVQAGSEVIAIGGSGRGADTAVVLRASNTHTFFDMHVSEIICKPRG